MDVAANPRAPEPLRLTRPVGGSGTQNAFVQNRVTRLQQGGATDLRINQQQVNISGGGILVAVRLPDHLAEFVRSFPEHKMGVHRVALVLADGSTVDDVLVAWGVEVIRVGDAHEVPELGRIVDVLDRN